MRHLASSAISRVEACCTRATQVLAHRFGLGRPTLESRGWTSLLEFPFSSDYKRMSVIFERPSQDSTPTRMVFMKGAVERVIEACRYLPHRQLILREAELLAGKGLRVLALAGRSWDRGTTGADRSEVEADMTVLGLLGIYDPPRTFVTGKQSDRIDV